MSWMTKLYETYEAGIAFNLSDHDKLMPICHTLQNAHINIVIDGDGTFKRASVLEKTQIVLPATEKSAGRSSGEAPHPLADKVQYVAKDYPAYGGRKKAYFDGYLKQLANWCGSQFSHPKAIAVYRYITQGKVVQNLVSADILHVDDNKNLLAYWPFETDKDNTAPLIFKVLPLIPKKKRKKKDRPEVEQGDALVCWTVEIEGEMDSSTWNDESLQQSWIAYDALAGGASSFCYISGKEKLMAVNHPAKLRHTGDKAKLVSANDSSGFTFRGRFTDQNGVQAVGVSFEVTQKAHNALRWLISRQGYRNGDQVYVSWAVSGKEIPDPLKSAWEMLDKDIALQQDNEPDKEQLLDHTIDLGSSFAQKLNKYLAGYKVELEPNEQIVIMGLDSATRAAWG
jgi:CRISPR-associated protein Csd1